MDSLRYARTYDRDVPRDGLRAATPRVTECPYESWGSRPTRAVRNADHRAKGHRWSRQIHRVGTRNANRPKEGICHPRWRAVATGKRSAVISRMLRLGRGRRKRASNGTSPAAYSTRWGEVGALGYPRPGLLPDVVEVTSHQGDQESWSQGKGAQVTRYSTAGRYAKCRAPKPF